MPTVTVAGVPCELAPPPKVSERWAPLLGMRPGTEVICMAAALGLCASALRKQLVYHNDVLSFGASVIDFLTSPDRRTTVRQPDGSYRQLHPATMAEIIAAGGAALALCRSNLVDVEGAADFTGPPAGTPNSGGPSSGGGSTPGNS